MHDEAGKLAAEGLSQQAHQLTFAAEAARAARALAAAGLGGLPQTGEIHAAWGKAAQAWEAVGEPYPLVHVSNILAKLGVTNRGEQPPPPTGSACSTPSRRSTDTHRAARRSRTLPEAALAASRTALRSLGARAASSATVSSTYRQAVAVPIPDPAARLANVSPLRRQARTRRACCPGFSFRRSEPIEIRWRRTIPAANFRV